MADMSGFEEQKAPESWEEQQARIRAEQKVLVDKERAAVEARGHIYIEPDASRYVVDLGRDLQQHGLLTDPVSGLGQAVTHLKGTIESIDKTIAASEKDIATLRKMRAKINETLELHVHALHQLQGVPSE